MSEHRSLFAIGQITKVFGVKGEVVVRPMTSSPERFKRLKEVFVGVTDKSAKGYKVARTTIEQRGVRVRFRELSDRTSVERLVGALLFVDERNVEKPGKGAHFIHDVVGLRVVDEENRELGIVKDVLRYPAQDVYVIDRGGIEWMMPAVKEYVKSIDVSSKTMRVHLIEGMMEQG